MPKHKSTSGLTPEQMHAVLENVQDGLVVLKPDGSVVYMNDVATHLYGFQEREGVELDSLNLQEYALDAFEVKTLEGERVPEDDRPLIRALRGEAYEDEELFVRHRNRDDARVFVFSSRRVDGDPPLGVLTVRDETDRWKAERRYRTTFETDPAPSLVARLEDTEILYVNAGMQRMTDQDLVGLTLKQLDVLDFSGETSTAVQAISNGEAIHLQESRLVTPHGQELDLLVSARSIEIDGDPCGIFTFIDVSGLQAERRERLKAQEELARAHTRLAEHRDTEQQRLGRDLHDGVLQGLLALNTKIANEEHRFREDGEAVAADASRRHREKVLYNAMQLRRVIRGTRPPALQELGLRDALKEVVPDLTGADRPTIILPTRELTDLPEEVTLTFYRIAQEGIANAVKHANASEVRITLDVESDEAVLRIEDDGKGFEVPERLTQLEQDDHFGMIGMQERAAVRGGDVHVRSAPGEGTTITCRIPLKANNANESGASEA